jgi:prepilin-type N-terminal cleavage/methylation domain-containing protein
MKSEELRGFSLMELIVAIAILAGVGIVLSQIFISTFRSNTKTEILKEVKQNGEFALDVMTRTIQNSIKINSSCTGVAADFLTITNPDAAQTQTTFGCALDTNNIPRLASTTGGVTSYITSKNVSLGGTSCPGTLSFTCRSTVGLPSSVLITMTLGQSGTAVDQFERSSASFQTSVSARNVPIH